MLVVADVHPKPRGLRFTAAGVQHVDRRVVRMDFARRFHVRRHAPIQRFEQLGDLAQPASLRAARNVDAQPLEDIFLAIQRLMIRRI